MKQEENLSGFMNTKMLKLKNVEYKAKIDYWKKSEESRRRVARRTKDKELAIIERLQKYVGDYNIERDKAEQCITDFYEFVEAKKTREKHEKIVNAFLTSIPEMLILEISYLTRGSQDQRAFTEETALLTDFVTTVRQECVLN